MEWLWFAHVWVPGADSCEPAAVATAAELTGLARQESVEALVAGAQDELVVGDRYANSTTALKRILEADGGVFLLETVEGDWITVAGYDGTRAEPWLVSDCHDMDPAWWSSRTLKRSWGGRVVSLTHVSVTLDQVLEMAEYLGAETAFVQPNVDTVRRWLHRSDTHILVPQAEGFRTVRREDSVWVAYDPGTRSGQVLSRPELADLIQPTDGVYVVTFF